MDNQGKISELWTKEQKVISRCLSQIKLRLSVKYIHDIRVAIKKLRAYLKLFFLLKGQPEFESPLINTNNLFKVLGKQREIEICIELTTRYETEIRSSLKFWRAHLLQMLKITKGWSIYEIRKYNKNELATIGLLIRQDFELTSEKNIENIIRSVLKKLQDELKENLKQPHNMRKKLKEVYFWLRLTPSDKIENSYNTETLHEILDILGNLQDYEILLIRIKHFRKDFLLKSFEEYKELKEFEGAIIKKKKLLLHSATIKIKTWLEELNIKSGE